MFLGEYNHTIDAKGRLIIPSKYREALGNNFIVTKGLEGCLYVFERSEFDSFMDKLNEQSDFEARSRKMKRFFVTGAQEVEPDKQGRMLVSQVHRVYAGLDKDVVWAGVGNHFEIWDKQKWDENMNFDDIDEIAESFAQVGIKF